MSSKANLGDFVYVPDTRYSSKITISYPKNPNTEDTTQGIIMYMLNTSLQEISHFCQKEIDLYHTTKKSTSEQRETSKIFKDTPNVIITLYMAMKIWN